MIIHEVTQELVTIAEDSWAIQLGAFSKRSNAEAYRRTLHKLLGKDVEIVIEGNYYKVRILDLKTRDEVDNNIAILKKNGVTELWVIRLKAKQQQLVLTEKVDTVTKITETYIEAPVPVFSFEMVLQVGAFNNESYATRLRDRLTATINKPVIIVPEDGFYKVRITGFENLEEIEKLIPALDFLGLNDLWIPPVTKEEVVTPPAMTEADSIGKAVIEKPQLPVLEEKPVVTEPTYALQVGVYRKKIQALRAQRKIMSKLKLPVDIVEQWGYYHVVVTGFFTKEETYRYFPELTGLGYPGISLIENYRKKEE
jgi:cell division protein FtsN